MKKKHPPTPSIWFLSWQLLGLLPVYYLISSLPSSSQRMEELTEEHRRLIAQTGHGDHGYYGGSRSYDYDHERAGGASATPIQHSVGGPAGSYEARMCRCGPTPAPVRPHIPSLLLFIYPS